MNLVSPVILKKEGAKTDHVVYVAAFWICHSDIGATLGQETLFI